MKELSLMLLYNGSKEKYLCLPYYLKIPFYKCLTVVIMTIDKFTHLF